jgi:small subunit ribosomal protein S17
MTEERNKRKTRVGFVLSDRMDKTVVVRVESTGRHPMYGKTLRQVRKFKAHNEGNVAHQGDKVLIVETRPLSKDKRWRVVQVLGKAE